MHITKRKKFLQIEARNITQMGFGVGEIPPEAWKKLMTQIVAQNAWADSRKNLLFLSIRKTYIRWLWEYHI